MASPPAAASGSGSGSAASSASSPSSNEDLDPAEGCLSDEEAECLAVAAFEAAASGDVGGLAALLERGRGRGLELAAVGDETGRVLAHEAAFNGRTEVLALLGSFVGRRRQTEGEASGGEVALEEAFLAAEDELGWTPCHAAAMIGHAGSVLALAVAVGAAAADGGGGGGPAELLGAAGLDGSTPLHLAAAAGHAAVIEVMLDLLSAGGGGAVTEVLLARNSAGQTALHCAIMEGQGRSVGVLLDWAACQGSWVAPAGPSLCQQLLCSWEQLQYTDQGAGGGGGVELEAADLLSHHNALHFAAVGDAPGCIAVIRDRISARDLRDLLGAVDDDQLTPL